MGMTWIFYEEIVPSSLFPTAVRPRTFWYTPGKGCHRLLNWQIQITKVSWVGQSTSSDPAKLILAMQVFWHHFLPPPFLYNVNFTYSTWGKEENFGFFAKNFGYINHVEMNHGEIFGKTLDRRLDECTRQRWAWGSKIPPDRHLLVTNSKIQGRQNGVETSRTPNSPQLRRLQRAAEIKPKAPHVAMRSSCCQRPLDGTVWRPTNQKQVRKQGSIWEGTGAKKVS